MSEPQQLVLRPGTRLASAVCTTEVVVVRVVDPGPVLECGGAPMRAAGTLPALDAGPATGFDGGTIIGKRYADESGTVEVLCVKAGAGTLSVDGTVLGQRTAKPLPASD